MSITPKQKKILSAVVALCLLLSAGIITGAFFFQKETEKPLYNADKNLTKGDSPVIESTEKDSTNLTTYVPKTATSVYSAVPKSNDEVEKWWSQFLLLSKYRLDMPLNITQVESHIQQMTLVTFPSTASYAENVAVILRMKDNDHVTTMNNMGTLLENLPQGSDTLVDMPKDNLILISNPASRQDMTKTIQGKGTISDNPNFLSDTKGVKDSMLWFDFSSYLKSVTSPQMQQQAPNALKDIQHSLMGFQDDTRWVSKSNDFGNTWIGKFPSGGYDKSLQNLSQYEEKASGDFKKDSIKKTAEEKKREKEANSSVDMGGFEAGPLMGALEAVAVSTKGDEKDQHKDLGQVRDITTGKYTKPVGDLSYYDSLIMLSPAMLSNIMGGSGLPATNIQTYTLKVREGMMEMTTQFNSNSPSNELLKQK